MCSNATGQRRHQASTWGAFLRHHQDQIVACDFFTVETLFLKTVYIHFFSATRGWLNNCPA